SVQEGIPAPAPPSPPPPVLVAPPPPWVVVLPPGPWAAVPPSPQGSSSRSQSSASLLQPAPVRPAAKRRPVALTRKCVFMMFTYRSESTQDAHAELIRAQLGNDASRRVGVV